MFAPSIHDQVYPDPVLSEAELPRKITLYPLGFPLQIATNSADVIEAARETWGPFTQAFDKPAMRLQLGVMESPTARLPNRPQFRSREHLMSIFLDAENFVTCDFNQSFAFGWATRRLASNHPLLRYRLLSAAVLCMAEQQSLAPLHGALVTRNNCGVALFGDSFAGKSTLAYACARSGWTYVSDDGIFLVRDRFDRYAIGDPNTIRFREDAKQLFPELVDRFAITRPNGKIGLEVFTRDLPITPALGATIDHIVFLNRNHPGPAHLKQYSEQRAQDYFERFVTYGTSSVRAAQLHAYRRLAGIPVWELCYHDLEGARDRLNELTEVRPRSARRTSVFIA